ncbi:outer membrane protein [Gemmatimonas sp.]|uniref:outer membrane protein n=1 Tax=Gemmatimonas sp. TaxID=1962908 RepID=UPI0037BEC1A6
MKRTLRAFGLVAALAAPVALSAQSTNKPVSLGVSGGLSLPMGDFGKALNSGYNITGHVYFKPASLQAVRLRGDVSFDRWAVDGSGDNSRRALGVIGNVVYDFPTQSTSMIKPYVLGGLGLFNSKSTITIAGTEVSGSDTNFGVQAGAGLAFQLSGFSTFVEGRLVNVFSDNTSIRYVPITFGVRF